ncbi:MAG: class I SAM-dependent methyltransferase [Helicobacteraceae bacterium]|nr:class I SAM-dependent methyltransferase [Helicobacteraceae bacterium]
MSCYICGCKSYHKRDGKVRDDNSINILECDDCGLVFLDNFKEMDYEGSKMHEQARVYELTERRDLIKDQYLFNKSRLDFCLNFMIGKDVLDFGSGYGGFAILAKEFANSISAVELESAVEPIYQKEGIPLFKNLVELENKKFDLITAFHVIEHLSEPANMLKSLAKLLKKGGRLIVEVPNANDALLSIYENRAFMEFTYWSAHFYLFNTHTLRKLGQKAGLRVDFVKPIQRYPLSNTLYWLSRGLPAGQKKWGNFIDSISLCEAYGATLASLGATDTLIASFSVES